MNPRLVAIAGPVSTRIFPLVRPEVFLGRAETNEIVIDDKSMSRRHCVILKEGLVFQLTDLDSHNGTFVNDLPVRERVLEHGDRIRIGNSLFLFVVEETEPAPLRIGFIDQGFVTQSAIKVRLEDAVYQMARDLSILMKIGKGISSIRELPQLEKQLLEMILEVVPANRGVIIVTEEVLDRPVSTCVVDRFEQETRVDISRRVAEEVLNERSAIMCNDVAADPDLARSASLANLKISSLLCVPIEAANIKGIIYLDTSDISTRFNEGQMRLLAAISGIAGMAIENVRHVERLEGENQRLLDDIQLEHNMVGESPRIKEILRLISKAARADSTVLILGESGTGKELAAWAVHRNSPRAAKPFVAVNCAALTESLLESELFGHEKGAFTGALARKKGKLELAHDGTVFLDEVGELSPVIQSKLLRVLQTRQFERVGGNEAIHSDFRLIAATNRDLAGEVGAGRFRQDLFYRLNVVAITMPPLRERREDIDLLVSYFVIKYGEKCKRKVIGVSDQARKLFTSYDWPGNIRELENAVERAVVMGSSDVVTHEDLPEYLLETSSFDSPAPGFYEAVRDAKKKIILETIERAGGNYAEAAAQLGIHTSNLHRLIRSLDLKPAIKSKS